MWTAKQAQKRTHSWREECCTTLKAVGSCIKGAADQGFSNTAVKVPSKKIEYFVKQLKKRGYRAFPAPELDASHIDVEW